MGTDAPPKPNRPRRPLRGPLTLLIGGAAVAALVVVWEWSAPGRDLDHAFERGLVLLADAQDPSEIEAALARWESETQPQWRGRSVDLVGRVLDDHSLEDPRVRALLQRVTGVDFGERRDDWRQWYETQRRQREGRQPGGGTRVRLKPAWRSPVGLTAWFTTIIPLDGTIYVASLGTSLDDADDAADGLVAVDGATGEARLIFQPDGGARGIIGIAAADERLFASGAAGAIYCLRPDGTLLWRNETGARLVSAPLCLDLNANGDTDVVAVTAAGTVVAASGTTGRTVWTASLRERLDGAPGAEPVQATLAAADVLGSGAVELVVTTTTGGVYLLDARTGKRRWSSTNGAGFLGGAVGAAADVGPPAYVADRGGRVWSFVRSGNSVELVPTWTLRTGDAALVASLRTLGDAARRPTHVLACTAGALDDAGGGVGLFGAQGALWQNAPGGVIWGTPAIADINADERSEILVASIRTTADGATGLLSVLSQDGHGLHRVAVDAAIECSPVVADVDGDGLLEVLLADQAGVLHCYDSEGYGPVEWGLLGGDSHNTRNAANAYAFGQVPFGHQHRWRPRF